MAYRIFANHAHVSPKEIRPQGTVQCLRDYLEECQIEKAVCFAPFRQRLLEDNFLQNQNEWLAEQIEGDERFVGFGTVHFAAEDIAAQVHHIADLGFLGIKIHPAAQEIHVMGDKAREVYAAAEERGLFLSFHTGIHWHRIRDYQLLLFDEVAFHYPRLRFSMEHMGGYHFFNEALAVMCNNRDEPYQVYAGWTSIHPDAETGLPGAWTISDEQLRILLHQTGSTRSIFGLDFPFNNPENIRTAIARIQALEIPEETKIGILGGNLARVLGVEW